RDLAPTVMSFYGDPAPRRRVSALKLMGRLFSTFRDHDKLPDFQESVLPPIIVLARNDPEEQVRVEAVHALGAWGAEEVVDEALKEISSQDAAQSVRYAAQVILLKQAQAGKRTSPDKGKSP